MSDPPQLVLDVAGHVALDGGPVGPVTAAADELIEILVREPVSAARLSDRLCELARAVRAATGSARPAVVSAEDSAAATRAHAAGLAEDALLARIRYDEFFEVRRVRGLPADEQRLVVLDTVTRVLEDVKDASIGLAEITDLLRGARAMLAAAEPIPVAGEAPAPTMSGVDGGPAMQRWVTGHHLFALCSDFGYHHISSVTQRLVDGGGLDTVALERAETFVRAASAALCYAASMPSAVYLERVRPLMDAASGTAHGFSGIDNYDYLLMREAWERLHETLMSSALVSDEVVRLFEAIVEENERHTLVAAALVGSAPSLKQLHDVAPISGAAGVPAVEALRQNTDQRREMLELLIAQTLSPTGGGT